MKYAKMINENEIEELNPDYIKIDGMVYTNPLHNPNIDINELGYKEFVIDDMPQFDVETQCVERYYQIRGNKIHRSWRVRNLTAEEIAEREARKQIWNEMT